MNKIKWIAITSVMLLMAFVLVSAAIADSNAAKPPPPNSDAASTGTCNLPSTSPSATGGPVSTGVFTPDGSGDNDSQPTAAPDAYWPGPDGYGYVGSTFAFNWVEISGTGTPILDLTDDSYSGPFPLGLTFNFYGSAWTDFYVGSNGFISFGEGFNDLSNQCPLPTDYTPDNIIPIMWDDLFPNYSIGGAYYQFFASCPIGSGSCIIVEYLNWALYADGSIVMQFLDSGTESGSSSTTGIEGANFASNYGLTYACDSAGSLADSTAIGFSVLEGVFILPETQDARGCEGVPQDHTFSVFNSTGSDTTVDLDYTVIVGEGACTGPASVGVPDGGIVPVVITITPSGDPGAVTTCEIYAEDANYASYYDYAYINKTIVSGLNEWLQIPDEPNGGRMDNVTAAYDGKIWSIAGYGYDNDVRSYDPLTDAWTVVGTPAPFGTNYASTGCTVGNTVYLYGDSSTVGFTDLWSYNMDTGVWAQLSPTGTPPAFTGIWAPAWAFDIDSGFCFMTGGASTPGAGNLTTAYVYDPVGNAWLTPLPDFTTARDFHAAFFYDNTDGDRLLCVVGGNNGAEIDSTQCYNFTTEVWNAENADMGPLPGGLWGMGYSDKWQFGTDHQLWLAGGVDITGLAVTNTWYFDVNTTTWLAGGDLTSGAVYRTSAVTLNNDIYKLGGSSGGFTPVGWADHQVQMVCPVLNEWVFLPNVYKTYAP
jgi:hypothetical protein